MWTLQRAKYEIRQDLEPTPQFKLERHFIFIFIFFAFKFYFIFKLYKIVLVLPNIKMNPPQVYMCSPS